MGAINDLLKNDTDGRIRQSILRGITVVTLLFATVIVLFVSGLLWRLFTGADLEAWGIRVWNKSEAGKNAVTPPPGPAAPIGPVVLDVKDVSTNTTWINYGAIDQNTCIQYSRESFGRPGFQNVQTLSTADGAPIGHLAFRIEDGRNALVQTRCMNNNGFATMFILGASTAAASARLALDSVLTTASAREKGALPTQLNALESATGWRIFEAGTHQGCVQVSSDAFSKLNLSDVASVRQSRDNLVTGHRGMRREKGATVAALTTVCAEMNGAVQLNWTAYGNVLSAQELSSQFSRELASLIKDANAHKTVGAVGRLTQATFIRKLTFASPAECTTALKEKLASLKAAGISPQGMTVYAAFDFAQMSATCLEDGTRTTVTAVFSGYSGADVNATRDSVARSLDAFNR